MSQLLSAIQLGLVKSQCRPLSCHRHHPLYLPYHYRLPVHYLCFLRASRDLSRRAAPLPHRSSGAWALSLMLGLSRFIILMLGTLLVVFRESSYGSSMVSAIQPSNGSIDDFLVPGSLFAPIITLIAVLMVGDKAARTI